MNKRQRRKNAKRLLRELCENMGIQGVALHGDILFTHRYRSGEPGLAEMIAGLDPARVISMPAPVGYRLEQAEENQI